MSSTTLKHIPLARPTEQIRLLKLQPGADIIRLNMQSYELTESPAFVALSYEWGEGLEMHDVIIDGAVFKIRQNLRDALKHIRILQADRSSTRLFDEDSPLFWIDAITIDQSNRAEKNHQVSKMGNIFRQASHVIAWLGVEQRGDGSALAIKHLNTRPEGYWPRQSLSRRGVGFPAEEEAIRRLCARSYFQRIWIVQECVLARKLHLVCGLQYCSWEPLHRINDTRESGLVGILFDTKQRFERGWYGASIQDAISGILHVAVGRHCSQFHDRIYGLLGILQQSFRSTGMVVDYAVSSEELMISTEELLNSNPELEDDARSTHHLLIQQAVEPDISTDVRGNVAWYWQINEIMHKLDAEVIKGFHKLETLGGEKERALTFQTICWIAGGYGVDLLSPVKDITSLNTATTMQTISLKVLEDERVTGPSTARTFIMSSRFTTGVLTYCISLTHRSKYALPQDYMTTESKSWRCRNLLETYSKHVQSLVKMRESFKVSTTVSDLQTESQLPVQVEWIVFSNLLAQYFLRKYSCRGRNKRNRSIDGFVRQVEPEGKDLSTFLTESLFNKYRMSVAKTSDELPANALESVDIEITNRTDSGHCSDFAKGIIKPERLVASLHDNYPTWRFHLGG